MKRLVYFIVPVLVLSMVGCASTKNKSKRKDIKVRVSDLETRVDELEQKTNTPPAPAEDYSSPAVKSNFTPATGDTSVSSSVSMSKKEIQTALKNAGYYAGAIDGKIGPKSQQAIKDFQSANGLKADGVVGPKTAKALQRYL